MEYNFNEIEKKWQKYWAENKSFEAVNGGGKEKYYVLVEFPYPSGSGLHVGHGESYSALDSLARMKRLQGYNVLFPMGWDSFGLPAENYAIKHKVHPREAVKRNVATFKQQIQSLGISFDWSREFATSDPEYYKWTQWIFLKLYEKGLAEKQEKNINWCPSCKVGLSNEDVENGKCQVCKGEVVRKKKSQWVLKMTEYADKLLEGLDETDYLERIKRGQRNWIGRSEGANVTFEIKDTDEKLDVYTTRPDTLYGVTFMVIAPEHPIINTLKDKINNMEDIEKYKEQASKKSDFERLELVKDKTGVVVDGISVINPITNEEIPLWISDYVMMGYGTGAIMAVPAHDQRDYEFAKKFDIPIIEVIKGGDISKEAYTESGEMINSGVLNGINNKEESIKKMISYLEENKIGYKDVNYRMQDWVFSRQRFWGEPIPMVYCEHCGWVPVPEEELPVTLPDVTSYEPTDNGESPLANIPEWYETTCPKCGAKAKRETDTMPQWAGSSWYWLRYMDPHNDDEFVSEDALKYWGMVDLYNGEMGHVTRHLLYARFWHRFLYDQKLVPTKEPFKMRIAHGMVLGADGEKMAKSRPQYVVNPNDVVNNYGADSLRMFEMFMGDYEQDVIWKDEGLKGCFRFLNKVWRMQEKVNESKGYSVKLEAMINKTVKKVTEDIESRKFNTAISALMILSNEMNKQESISKDELRTFLILLNPFAPHITEEMNELLGSETELVNASWPTYDESKTLEETFEMIVQVNGKVRAKVTMNSNASKEGMEEEAFRQENVIKFTEGKEVVKKIVVPNKLVNIVVK